MRTASIFLLTICWFAQGLAQADKDQLNPYFFSIISTDIDNSIEWYEKLGFEIINKNEFPDRGFSQANLSNGVAALELIEISGSLSTASILADQPKKTKIQGFFKMGFRVKDLSAWVQELKAKGIVFSGNIVTDPVTKKDMIIILDPDGNRIQLFQE